MAYRTTHNIIYFYFLTDQFRIPTRNTYVFFSVANNLRIMWKQNILLMQNCSYFIFQLFGECWAKFHQIKNRNCTTDFVLSIEGCTYITKEGRGAAVWIQYCTIWLYRSCYLEKLYLCVFMYLPTVCKIFGQKMGRTFSYF